MKKNSFLAHSSPKMYSLTYFFLLSVLSLNSFSHASRMHRDMGYYIRNAELIAIVDTTKGGPKGFKTLLTFKKIIKGDPQWEGKQVLLPMIKSTGDAYVPRDAKNIAVLFKAKWNQTKEWPVLETYQKEQEVKVLQKLISIYQLTTEGEQLKAIIGQISSSTTASFYQEQLLTDAQLMKDPKSLELILEFYPKASPEFQLKLIPFLSQTGDLRVVPTLIQALFSSEKKISATAIHTLYWNYPGALGVTEAIKKVQTQKELRQVALRYLSKRTSDPKIHNEIKTKPTRWLIAQKLKKEGKELERQKILLEMIQDTSESDYVRRYGTKLLLSEFKRTEEQQTLIRQAMLSFLKKDATSGNYLHMQDAALILKDLHHSDCLESLLLILKRKGSYSLFQKAQMFAATAIRELPSPARQKAMENLIEIYQKDPQQYLKKKQNDTIHCFLEFLWICDTEGLARVKGATPASFKSHWDYVAPLTQLTETADEGKTLITILQEHANLNYKVLEWLLFRLGDLKEKRAIKVLTTYLVKGPGWQTSQIAAESLKRIGGDLAEQEMLKLLTHKDKNRVRRHVVEVLFEIQGERGLKLARQMLEQEDFGDKNLALTRLVHIGSPEEFSLILPLCDFWKADRKTHYWAMSAAASIRDKYNYDLNGPIQKE